MSLPYRMDFIPDPDEGGYVVVFPELKGCFGSGKTYDEAIRNAMDAKREWFTAVLEEHLDIPLPEAVREHTDSTDFL